jgi:hypothetical protein
LPTQTQTTAGLRAYRVDPARESTGNRRATPVGGGNPAAQTPGLPDRRSFRGRMAKHPFAGFALTGNAASQHPAQIPRDPAPATSKQVMGWGHHQLAAIERAWFRRAYRVIQPRTAQSGRKARWRSERQRRTANGADAIGATGLLRAPRSGGMADRLAGGPRTARSRMPKQTGLIILCLPRAPDTHPDRLLTIEANQVRVWCDRRTRQFRKAALTSLHCEREEARGVQDSWPA